LRNIFRGADYKGGGDYTIVRGVKGPSVGVEEKG